MGNGSSVGSGVCVGSGVWIGGGVYVSSGSSVGSGVCVGSGVYVGSGSRVGSGVWVGRGVYVGRGVGVGVSPHVASRATATKHSSPTKVTDNRRFAIRSFGESVHICLRFIGRSGIYSSPQSTSLLAVYTELIFKHGGWDAVGLGRRERSLHPAPSGIIST